METDTRSNASMQGSKVQPTKANTISRRRFLRHLGTAGAAVTVGGTIGLVRYREEAQAQSGHSMEQEAKHQWAMVIDLRHCDGCGDCTKGCQKAHFLSKEQTWINVYKMTNSHGHEYFMPRPCMHCENAPCVRVCPVGATFQDEEGIVLVDQNKCIGCRTCMAACPYEARYFNFADPPKVEGVSSPPTPQFPVPQQKGTVGKCMMCVHRTGMGKFPACLEACTMDAIYLGDLQSDLASNGKETVKLSTFLRDNDAVRYKEHLGTKPRVYYIQGHGQLVEF